MKSYNQEEMECTWTQVIDKGPDVCQQTIDKVARQLNLSPRLFYNPYGIRDNVPTASVDEILMGKGQGRGTIIIHMIANNNLIRHIFPFENGLIYDSACAELGGVIFSEIVKRYTQWGNKDIKVVAIHNEDDFKVKL